MTVRPFQFAGPPDQTRQPGVGTPRVSMTRLQRILSAATADAPTPLPQ